MKTIKFILITITIAAINIGQVWADFLPPQPGDPGSGGGGMSVPIDGGILMALLAGASLVTVLFKKKKKDL